VQVVRVGANLVATSVKSARRGDSGANTKGRAMRLELWAGRSSPREVRLRERHTVVPDEPGLFYEREVDLTKPSFTVGRSPDNDLVLDDKYVSRCALRFWGRDGGWRVEYCNKHKVQHRRWAQQGQVPKARWEREFLAVGEHAFLIDGGQERDRAFCLLIYINDIRLADPSAGSAGKPRVVDENIATPPLPEPTRELGENLDRFCDVYRQFLRWPPLRRPEVIRDSTVREKTNIDPAHGVAAVIDYAISLGYSPGGAPTARQPDLPYFLATNGVLTFEEHAWWPQSPRQVAD
jgi:hypothetical protein